MHMSLHVFVYILHDDCIRVIAIVDYFGLIWQSGNVVVCHVNSLPQQFPGQSIELYVCVILRHSRIHMDIGNSKNYLGVFFTYKQYVTRES